MRHYAEINRQLIINILRYLKMNKQPKRLTVNKLFHQIERDMAVFVTRTLLANDKDWWQKYVPDSIRAECEKRRTQEKNIFPNESYLDLLHLKKIMDKNWNLFYELLSTITEESKKKFLKRTEDFNASTRRFEAHPIKTLFMPQDYSEAYINRVKELADLARQLRISAILKFGL